MKTSDKLKIEELIGKHIQASEWDIMEAVEIQLTRHLRLVYTLMGAIVLGLILLTIRVLV